MSVQVVRTGPGESASALGERELLGALIAAEGLQPASKRWQELPGQLRQLVSADDFEDRRLAAVYQAVFQLLDAQQPVTLITLGQRLEQNGVRHTAVPALAKLTSDISCSVDVALAAARCVRSAAADRRARLHLARAQSTSDPAERQQSAAAALEEMKAGAPAARGLHTTAIADVEERALTWLWHGRIPYGALTLLCGDPGQGKSVLTCHLAAMISRGGMLPGDQVRMPPGNVLLIAHEDASGVVIKPRLIAAGADQARVLYCVDVPTFPAHVERVAETLRQHQVSLVVIDPITAYLDPKINAFSDQEIRQALAPLAQMAESSGAAVVVVAHMNKGAGKPGLYRVGGSIGLVGQARSALLLAVAPDNPQQRVLAPLKMNLAKPAPSLLFCLEDDLERSQPRIQWLGECTHTAEHLLSQDDRRKKDPQALKKACEVVRSILAKGPAHAVDVEEQAELAGVSEATLKRARKKLRVVSEKKGGVGPGQGYWQWRLPTDDELS